MKRSERDEWVQALRSGEFIQGQGTLDQNGKQCCLGVKCLLDIAAGRHGICAFIVHSGFNQREFGIAGSESFEPNMPTGEILEAWGLSIEAADKLADMNDKCTSFPKIADWIEQNVQVEDD
jgi:hypothetical protein